MKRFISISVFLLILSSGAYAQLDFEKTNLAVRAEPGDIRTVLEFNFQNKSKKEITILDVKTCCACTVTSLARKKFKPGEKGTLEATFVHGTLSGLQRKNVTVTTNDSKTPVIQLNYEVTIPDWLNFSPPFLLWKIGSAVESKEMDIHLNNPAIEILKVARTDAQFNVTLLDKEKKIRVLPLSTSSIQRSVIRVQVRLPDKTIREFNAYALVK